MGPRRRQWKRLCELGRLGMGRRARGDAIGDLNKWLFVLAKTLASATPLERTPIPGKFATFKWPGLNSVSLKQAVLDCGLSDLVSDNEMEKVRASVERWTRKNGPKPVSAADIGAWLEVTAAERELYRVTTFDACDETREERTLRLAERRREKDRVRKAAERASKPGYRPQSTSLSRTKPWCALEISRPKYYRLKAAGKLPLAAE
jgi:hypothetical protein